MNVGFGLNNRIDAREASKILGCSYTAVIGLIQRNKLKAQKVGKHWYLDSDDVYRAKNSGLIKPRKRKPPVKHISFTNPALMEPIDSEYTTIQLKVKKEHLQLIEMAFRGTNKTLVQYLNERVESLFDQIKAKLQGIEL